MKKLFVMMVAVALVCSCTKEEMMVEPGMESTLYLTLAPDGVTKASGDGHGNQAEDNTIQTLEVFIFRCNEGKADDGILDGYKKFTGQEAGNLTGLEIKTTTGKKMIYVVANSHRENWKGINTRTLFEEQRALLAQDASKNFLMTGSTEAYLQVASTIIISMKRMAARVKLNSVKTAFEGGVYEGAELTDVKAYLINVQGSKVIYNGLGNNLSVLNSGQYVAEDASSCAMPGMLYDNLASSITDSGYDTPHYFYCYENNFTKEEGENKFTRLVIEGKLNGTTYYYPLPIKGIVRNNSYSVDITIKRPGSLDPGKDVEKSTVMMSVGIKDWETVDKNNVEF